MWHSGIIPLTRLSLTGGCHLVAVLLLSNAAWRRSATIGWVSLYVHSNRRRIRDGSPGRPLRLSHGSSWALPPDTRVLIAFINYSKFSALEQTHCALVACDSKWVTVAFCGTFLTFTQVVYLQRCLVVTWLVPRETAAVSARFCTPCHVTSCKAAYVGCVSACLAVTYYLHLWQNNRDLSRAAAVTRGCNGCPNNSHAGHTYTHTTTSEHTLAHTLYPHKTCMHSTFVRPFPFCCLLLAFTVSLFRQLQIRSVSWWWWVDA